MFIAPQTAPVMRGTTARSAAVADAAAPSIIGYGLPFEAETSIIGYGLPFEAETSIIGYGLPFEA